MKRHVEEKMQSSTASKVTEILSRKLPVIGSIAAPVVKRRKSCSPVWRKFDTFALISWSNKVSSYRETVVFNLTYWRVLSILKYQGWIVLVNSYSLWLQLLTVKNGVSVIARWPLNSTLIHRLESVAAFCIENVLSYILTVHEYQNTGLSFDNVGELGNTNASLLRGNASCNLYFNLDLTDCY